ncbi:hypothetical protein ASPWEDRAFT_166944 [Aspergillus wentii DTO 134E9]|uniref:MARVEL domain-containing protein n=1 Tax=Aspergillus wentii DTO 134E9 TaxID=1073089 RepID=A0A1L9S194_ASPWE|nr:uncharacterized protein ASPWEDRAFT_166944 [Aspergillus wentii DTO 134E9]OJJ40893.1 hypothetical protein ASPWEDRAFT_166944 [Aspergillus wentii DTO 134E9]
MIPSLFFIFNRLVEIVFLIPIIGMMSYFVNGYLKANQLTPPYILVLFIVSVLAVFWAIDTLIRHGTTKRSAIFVAFVDLLFCGAFIAGVYELRFIANANCLHWEGGAVYVSLGPFGLYGERTGNPLALDINKSCAMLKTCFAFGIMETLFFSWTAFWAIFMYQRESKVVVRETKVRRRSHSSRRGHSNRHRSSSSRRPHYVV